MEEIIGVDSLDFLNMENLGKLIGVENGCGYCDACFTNNYPTPIPEQSGKNKYSKKPDETVRFF